mgnify:CR=1 FL=1
MTRIARFCLIVVLSALFAIWPDVWSWGPYSGRAQFDGASPKGGSLPLARAQDQDQAADAEALEPPADPSAEGDGLKPFDTVTENLEPSQGMFTLYQNLDQKTILAGIRPDQLNRNFLLIATLESGIGEMGLFRGWPINDLVIQFRQAPDNQLQVVVPNFALINPEQSRRQRQLLQQSFSDSVLFALPIVSIHPETNEMLIDLGEFLLNRDPANLRASLGSVLGGYSQDFSTSYVSDSNLFPQNLELETVLGFAGGAGDGSLGQNLRSLPDSRGFSLRVHYSLSLLTGHAAFKPRPADERVGYFITAFRTPNPASSGEPFVRYIHRWHLEKRDASAALSPPQEPIVFWIENAVPQDYRQAIWAGIEFWNRAFEQAGFRDAIEVRQMPDDADWDAADVRYNVIRWSDSFIPWALGLGPSRVNPLTGEILDADVIIDASVVRYLNRQYETYISRSGGQETTAALMQLCDHPLNQRYLEWMARSGNEPFSGGTALLSQTEPADYCAGMKAAQHTAFGALALETLSPALADQDAQADYIYQYLRALTAHEVGHVLGLRHNFLGSTLLPPEDLNNTTVTRSQGMVSSIMDYFPPNLAAPGQPQGDYFPTRLGPYDTWAIVYGYRPTSNPLNAHRELQAIARRSGSAELAYASDEDIFDFLDPKANAWDLSNDPLQYAQWQIANAKAIWNKLDWYSVNPGEGYGNLRQRVDLVFDYYLQQALTLCNYIGGQRFNRVDPWSSRGQPPFEAIPAEDQRLALTTLSREVFSADALQIPPDLVRLLAPDRWRHWGQALTVYPLDYPIYNRVLFVQAFTLSEILSSARLSRLRDAELKATETAPLTLADLLDTLTQDIWSELMDDSTPSSSIASVRRGLQRHYVNILSSLVLRNASRSISAANLLDFVAMEITWDAPEDARVLARYQLRQIQGRLTRTLQRQGEQMELTSRAHLEDVRDRIGKVLEAPLEAL